MDEIRQVFGSLTVDTVIVALAALTAIYKLYKKAESEVIKKYKAEEEEKKKVQQLMDQVPAWQKQNTQLRQELTAAIEEVKGVQVKNSAKLEEVARHMYENDATTARYRILRFNDEILHGTHHTKEHFDQILGDINSYESYCSSHPEYENNKAVLAIENIKKVYQSCTAKNDFL